MFSASALFASRSAPGRRSRVRDSSSFVQPLTLQSYPLAVRPLKTTIQPRNSTIPCKTLYLLANPVVPFPMFSSPSTSRRIAPRASVRFTPMGVILSRAKDLLLSSFSPLATIPFRIRTYEKCTPNSFRIRTSKTQDLKPFRIRTYEKTPGGAHPSHQIFVLPLVPRAYQKSRSGSGGRSYATLSFPPQRDDARLARRLEFAAGNELAPKRLFARMKSRAAEGSIGQITCR